jgi:ABC-2 type transport system permease protein
MISKKDLNTYKTFTINSFQKNLAYKFSTIIYLIGEILVLIVTYYLWKGIFKSSGENIINGFNFSEMVVYVLISYLTAQFAYTDVSYEILSEVKDGSISINLLRPLSYEKRMFAQGLGNVAYNFIVIVIWGLIGTTIYSFNSNISLTLTQILLYLLSCIFSILISFYYSYIFGLLSFKLNNMWGLSQVMGAVMKLLSGLLIPIVFFPTWAQGIFDLLPFKSMIYTPTMIFMGKLESIEIIKSLGIQVIWIVILSFISKKFWNKLIKDLVILGG